MRGMNNEKVCKHNPTFAQQRRACARCYRERGSYGREDKECAYDIGEVGLNSQVYVYNLNYKFDRVTEA